MARDVAEKIETAGRELKPIPTSCAKWTHVGDVSHMLVRLPEGITIQDIHDHPDLWRVIQQKGLSHADGIAAPQVPRGLKRFDEVTLIAFDESSEISPQRTVGLIQENSDRFQFTPRFELILSIGKEGWQESFGKTKSILEELVQFSKSRGTQSGPLALEET